MQPSTCGLVHGLAKYFFVIIVIEILVRLLACTVNEYGHVHMDLLSVANLSVAGLAIRSKA